MSDVVSWGQRREELETFVDILTSGARPEVLDAFEGVIPVFEDTLEAFHGYDSVEITHRPNSAVESFAGPVMGGMPRDMSGEYMISTGSGSSKVTLDVRDIRRNL